MTDQDKTREQLLEELEAARRRIAELESTDGPVGSAEGGDSIDKLKLAHLLLRSSVEGLPNLEVLSLDRQYRYLYFNKTHVDGMQYLYGTQADIREGGSFLDCISEANDRSHAKEFFGRALSGMSHSVTAEWGEGEHRTYFETFYSPITDEEGEVLGATAFAHDVTGRVRAEEALRESEDRFRTLFENVPLGYQSLDEDGTILEVNHTWCQLLGYTKREVLGRNFSEFIHSDFQEVFRENFPRFKSMGYTLGVEFEMISKDGSEVLVAFDGRIGKWGDGSFKQTHCVLADLTTRKLAEEGLKDSRDRLRSLTARLDEVREEERTALAGELHDEVGQNLTALRMDLTRVEKEIPDELKPLADSLRSMIALAQDSVDRVNRLSTKLRSPILDMLGLEDAVESEVGDYQERWGTEIGLEVDLGELEAGPERDLTIYRILKESLSNVKRHAQASRIEVSLRVVDEDLVLEVLDDGVGITDDQMDGFHSFGLMGIRERVERRGGKFEVLRRDGGGTGVVARLPITPTDS
jgi:PAS domain S-box-containing protein